MQPYVFISYSHDDNVIEYLERLFHNVGINYWFDHRIMPAEDWKNEIIERISQCELFFAVITQASVQSEYVIAELTVALEKGKAIFPLFIDNPIIPDSFSKELALLIDRIQHLNIKKCDLATLDIGLQQHIIHAIDHIVPISKLKTGALSVPKIIVFDFDGTLTKSSSRNTWELLWESIGYPVDYCDELEKEVLQTNQSYQAWCDRSSERFVQKGMSLKHIAEVAGKTHKIGHLEETLEFLVKKNIKLYILSGSVKQVINIVLKGCLHFFECIEANDFQFDREGRLCCIKATKYNYEKKADYIFKISEENGILCKDVLFIGNSLNDRFAYLSGAQTLCINPVDVDYRDSDAWTTYIRRVDDFRRILDYIFQLMEKY